jgi:hypothetical protein
MVQGGLRDRIASRISHAHSVCWPARPEPSALKPALSAGGSMGITLYGKGSHGSRPHNSLDVVVLAAPVVFREMVSEHELMIRKRGYG